MLKRETDKDIRFQSQDVNGEGRIDKGGGGMVREERIGDGRGEEGGREDNNEDQLRYENEEDDNLQFHRCRHNNNIYPNCFLIHIILTIAAE